MRKIILIWSLFIGTSVYAEVSIEQKASMVYKYFCKEAGDTLSSEDRIKCDSNMYPFKNSIRVYTKYEAQSENTIKTSNGLDAPIKILKALNTLKFFEYNNFPKYKLSESVIPLLKKDEVVRVITSALKLPINSPKYLVSKITKIIEKHNKLTKKYVSTQRNNQSIYSEHYGNLSNFSLALLNDFEFARHDLSSITVAAWEISSATFLKAAKFKKSLKKVNKAIDGISNGIGKTKAVYQFYKIITDEDALTGGNWNQTIKDLQDTFEMVSNYTGTVDTKIISLLEQFKLEYEQAKALYLLNDYYKVANPKVNQVFVISLREIETRMMMTMSELMAEFSKATGLDSTTIGDVVSVSNSLIQVFANFGHNYHAAMYTVSISDKYFKKSMELFKYHYDFVIEYYTALYPIAKYKLENAKSNKYYSDKQEKLGIYIAGFNKEDDNRVDKCITRGGFFKSLSEHIKYTWNDSEMQSWVNVDADNTVSVFMALKFLDKASSKHLGKFYTNGLANPKGNRRRGKVLRIRYKKHYSDYGYNDYVEAIVKRQFLMQSGNIFPDKTNNIDQCLKGYKAINFFENYLTTLEFYKGRK